MLLLALLHPLNCLSAQDAATTLSIRGDVQKPVRWSIDQLKERFAGQIKEVKFIDADKSQKIGTGIQLLSVIQACGPRIEKDTKWTLKDTLHHDLSFLVILEARDSYKVFFSLAELMQWFGNAQAWLLWNVNGKPLSGKQAPLWLVVSGQGFDRNIYGIEKITVVDGIKLANQLDAK